MRGLLLASSILMALCSTAYSSSPDAPAAGMYTWTGDLTYTAITPACTVNWVGDHTIALFTPAGLGTNGPNSVLSNFYSNFAISFRVAGPVTTAWKAAQGTDIGPYSGQFSAYMRFLTQSPASITTATGAITITGQISNFDYTPGCVVNFSLILQRNLK